MAEKDFMKTGTTVYRATQKLMLALALIILSPASLAESGNYRIEVLIFNHLDSTEPALQEDEIRSFSEFPELGEPLVANAPVKLDVMSSVMQGVMRRLRSSATYHPLLFASWEQTRIDYHPPVRLHDEELIAEQLDFPYEVAFVDLQAMDMFEDYLAPYYRLDGTVQLRRSRFLHVNLDLEYRLELLPRPETEIPDHEQPLAEDSGAELSSDQDGIAISNVAPLAANGDEPELIQDFIDPSPGPALVHALKQSRLVRTGQMQYFDTPFLGVLVRVTATSGQ